MEDMEIKILRRYNYIMADIEVNGIVYKEVYPVWIDNKHWGLTNDGNNIIVQYNIPEELQQKEE